MLSTKKLTASISIVFSGVVVSQIINLASLPILTRLFTPEDFGVLGIFVSIMTIALSLSSLKLEMAIPVQNSDKAAKDVFFAGILITTLISISSYLVLYTVDASFGLNLIGEYYYFISLGIFIGGVFQLLNYFAVFKKDYKAISISRVIQSSSSVFIQVLLGFFWKSPVILLIGYIVNLGGGFHYLINRLKIQLPKSYTLGKFKKTVYENKSFPKYSVIESLANTAGLQLPLLMIAYILGLVEIGYLFLAIKIFQAPIGLISTSVSQVFYSKSNEVKCDKQKAMLVQDVLIFLIKFGVSGLILLVALSNVSVTYIFGNKWESVSYYMLILAPWFTLQLIVSPLSTIMYTQGFNRKYMFLTLGGLFFKLSVLLISFIIFGQELLVMTLVLVNFLFYSFCFYTFLTACSFSKQNYINVIKESSNHIVLSLMVSLIVLNL